MAWVGRTAIEIAAAVRDGQVTAAAVVDEHLAHIDRVDSRVGAFEIVDHEGARAAARDVDSHPARGGLPLAGVPVGIKDNADARGLPSRHGSAGSSDQPVAADDVLVGRLRAAGAVVVGKTRMPELGLATVGDNAFGVARNPWNLDRIPGGSSSGSAAALASGQVPVALGSDGGGSVRVPSAVCGLVGIKPGDGTLPARGDDPRAGWCGMSQFGPMATTVADVALMLAVLADAPGLTLLPGLGTLRVATSDVPAAPFPVRIDDDVKAGWRRAVDTLAGAGHEIVAATPDYPGFMGRALASRSMLGARWDAERLHLRPRSLGRRTRAVMRIGRLIERLGLHRPEDASTWRRTADEFFEQFDVLVTPATGMTAYEARDWHNRGLVSNSRPSARLAAYTSPWNLADLPAASVPIGFAADGLPIGVQVVAGRDGEGLALALAAMIEREHPWPRHAPGWVDQVPAHPGR